METDEKALMDIRTTVAVHSEKWRTQDEVNSTLTANIEKITGLTISLDKRLDRLGMKITVGIGIVVFVAEYAARYFWR